MAKISNKIRQDHHYIWFEIFQIEDKSFEFKKLQEMELYVHHDMLAEGHFHEVNKAM